MKTFHLPILVSLLLTTNFLIAQVTNNLQLPTSINSTGAAPATSAMLDVSATDKGMLVPRMTSAQRTAIASPASGLLVFDTDTGGFWFYNGTIWTDLSSPKMLADADGDTKIQVEENPDEDIIRFDLGGTEHMVLSTVPGGSPQLQLPNALGNTFIGMSAGNSGASGMNNTAIGNGALSSNTEGTSNTATGLQALVLNTTGVRNTANGASALTFNSSGSDNTALSWLALFNNTTGDGNTAAGAAALETNTTGSNNTALGRFADVLTNNLTNATAIGYNAKVGASNSLVLGGTGADAVKVGIGYTSPTAPVMVKATSSTLPTGNGIYLYNDVNTIHEHAMISSRVAGSNGGDPLISLDVAGEGGWCFGIDNSDENKLKIANNWNNLASGTVLTFLTNGNVGIGRPPLTNLLEVEGDASKSSAGDWLANSDARLKKNISPLNSAEMLQKLLSLQGVTYEWNDDQTGSKRPEGIQYGFTAQNIQAVFPTLVEEDNLGYLQTAYGTYDAMTVEAIRALHSSLRELGEEIGNLKLENAALQSKVKDLEENQAAQLQKITAALLCAGIAVEK